MMLMASVRYEGEIQVVKNDTFTTKRAYADALRGNGYRVRFIAKPEEFDEVCENFYSRKNSRNAPLRSVSRGMVARL